MTADKFVLDKDDLSRILASLPNQVLNLTLQEFEIRITKKTDVTTLAKYICEHESKTTIAKTLLQVCTQICSSFSSSSK